MEPGKHPDKGTAEIRRLIARYLAVPDAMALAGPVPVSVEQLLEDLQRQRTLQVQMFRIMAYILPTALFIFFFHGKINDVFWKLSLVMVSTNIIGLYFLARVTAFRGLNAFLFFLDICTTMLMVWEHGVITAYVILFFPLMIVAMVYLLRKPAAVILTALATIMLLGLLHAQANGLIPVGTLAQTFVGENPIYANSWVLTSASLFTVMLLPGSWIAFNYLFGLLQQREYEVARANDAIRRYVPRQLADEIIAGTHQAGEAAARRKITVVFSDIQGFTDTADQMEPEEFSALLNDYLAEMALIAEQHGGTIDKFVGDAIMIFFGAPISAGAREDALGAVRMSVAMQRRMAELQTKWFNEGVQTPFRIRIGINTGVANVGSFGSAGRKDYTAIGNQVNVAARLQAACPSGKVLLSHTTWALVREEIEMQDAGEISVKGVHYPVHTYIVDP